MATLRRASPATSNPTSAFHPPLPHRECLGRNEAGHYGRRCSLVRSPTSHANASEGTRLGCLGQCHRRCWRRLCGRGSCRTLPHRECLGMNEAGHYGRRCRRRLASLCYTRLHSLQRNTLLITRSQKSRRLRSIGSAFRQSTPAAEYRTRGKHGTLHECLKRISCKYEEHFDGVLSSVIAQTCGNVSSRAEPLDPCQSTFTISLKINDFRPAQLSDFKSFF